MRLFYYGTVRPSLDGTPFSTVQYKFMNLENLAFCFSGYVPEPPIKFPNLCIMKYGNYSTKDFELLLHKIITKISKK